MMVPLMESEFVFGCCVREHLLGGFSDAEEHDCQPCSREKISSLLAVSPTNTSRLLLEVLCVRERSK